MATFNRLILSAEQVGARKRQWSHLTDIICGPDTTYRPELIEAISDNR